MRGLTKGQLNSKIKYLVLGKEGLTLTNQNKPLCFRLECPKVPSGTQLVVPFYFIDCHDQVAEASLAFEFCGADCLFRFAGARTNTQILEEVLSTCWHQKQSAASRPRGAPKIKVEKAEDDKVNTEFLIPTSWTAGKSQAMVSLPSSSPQLAATLWEACGRDHFRLLQYLYENAATPPKDKLHPIVIRFLVPARQRIEVSIPFASLDEAYEIWQQNGQDYFGFLHLLLEKNGGKEGSSL
ncbi:MAG: hypothetical protein A2731_02720 [Candidatus Buchananbacteria bacterium RIFCSPHIGHO2_01_FULL_39_8]|uniref:Uncharacterized protein n=1 Tax=Candidatus Buchananbacteria bacterium RIFCSPHIGHO2_01_FULL_39_8 TaxID=1797533 RepID=A0A1G1XTF0_9BACT|nr:MAG: hypothetical protein A2731_02720 [Candidatus Buchananbacteria bacterium RIFCSPHIGHO2_01_FULL_39_8]